MLEVLDDRVSFGDDGFYDIAERDDAFERISVLF